MNLVMLDIDGTLTQSYEYDKEVIGTAIGQVLSSAPVDADLNGYVDKTSLGVTREAIRGQTGRNPKAGEVEEVKRRVLESLEKMYRESPEIFRQVPGAAVFVQQLRSLKGVGIAIATGCWRSEALFKLAASGVNVEGIPMATSDDDQDRQRIMEISEKRAKDFHDPSGFKRVVYVGDGAWDVQAAHTLGYGFVGIGPRLQAIAEQEGFRWHKDFTDVEEVLASIRAALGG